MNFNHVKNAVSKQFSKVEQGTTFVVNLDRDQLWNAYLNSFDDLDIRQEHNCNCCKSFIRNYGAVVSIKDGKVSSIWDSNEAGDFQSIVDNLAKVVHNADISDIFVSKHGGLGTDNNIQIKDDGSTVKWQHFFHKLSNASVDQSNDSEATIMGKARSTKSVFERSLNEITIDASETVLELIAQNSLYRGQEFEQFVRNFLNHQKKYNKLNKKQKSLYVWEHFKDGGRIRNTAIGTLLVDISEGMDFDKAVTSFESKVAPANYKRPKAIVTKKMIEDAEKDIVSLGIERSLYRRHANKDDIPVSEVLFVNRDSDITGGLFEQLKEQVAVSSKHFSKVKEIGIDDFIKKIVPTATAINVLFENRHSSNLMNLIAPMHDDSPSIFKWDNKLSWDYNGGVADSMKERVKSVGGKVDGVLRFSIQWNEDGSDSGNDLDAHCVEPRGKRIYYADRINRYTGGNLDVDIRRPGNDIAVENITWPHINKMQQGKYSFYVHNYSGFNNKGFRAEIEFNGQVFEYNYSSSVKGTVIVAEVTLKNGEFLINHNLDVGSNVISNRVWGIDANKFHKVSLLTTSPNHWASPLGNKHTFFILEGCVNDQSSRGIFNEFLKEDFLKHKRLFEVLGNKLKVSPEGGQLAGLGFSSTKRDSVIVKVEGKFERILKIKF